MYACFWMMLRYSGRSGAKQLKRIDRKLGSMEASLGGELRERNKLLKNLLDRLSKDDK